MFLLNYPMVALVYNLTWRISHHLSALVYINIQWYLYRYHYWWRHLAVARLPKRWIICTSTPWPSKSIGLPSMLPFTDSTTPFCSCSMPRDSTTINESSLQLKHSQKVTKQVGEYEVEHWRRPIALKYICNWTSSSILPVLNLLRH